MFSTTTTAASTNMPMAIANPPRLIRLADMPNAFIMIKVNSAANGRDKATVKAARQSPRNSISRMMTRTTASSNAFVTVCTARSTK